MCDVGEILTGSGPNELLSRTVETSSSESPKEDDHIDAETKTILVLNKVDLIPGDKRITVEVLMTRIFDNA